MRDALRLGFAHLLEITAVSHDACGHVESRTVPHGGGISLVFVAQGRLVVTAGGKSTAVGCGEAILLEPAASQHLDLSCEGETEHYVVAFRNPGSPTRARRRTLEVPDHVRICNPGRLTHLMRLLMEESGRRGASPIVLHHLVVLLLCEMGASSRVGAETGAREDALESIASRVDAYIAAHYHEPIGTPDIALELRYNPDYLERAYRAERRQSIRAAIHARRFREAQAQLLLQGGRRIAEVAAQCGYADAGYFRRVFKRTTNLTPRGYRLMHAAVPGPAQGSAAAAPPPPSPLRASAP